ncbi:MAG: RNA polymerase sigma factor FliA [Rhodocyclaceae bacterium]|nr:RNA polymerase sigma factor FliA [Rhodocyclaceae bacterium]
MYTAQGTPEKEQVVLRFAPLVRRLAFQMMARLPASVQVDDLIQNGMIGLLDASARFEDGLGAQFETYAVQRIRGAMLDGLRESDTMPRGMRREMRRVEAVLHQLEHQHGRHPTEIELATALDISLADYQKLLSEARGHQVVYLEDLSGGKAGEEGEDFLDRHEVNHTPNPLYLLEEAGLHKTLVSAIERLPEREKMAMSLYYEEDLNLKEIGAVMGVTESRVCQLHSQAVARLRVAVLGSKAALEVAMKRKEKKKHG